MTASEARDRVINVKEVKKSFLPEIRKKIDTAINNGFGSVFVGSHRISFEDKTLLEEDGYYVETRFTTGFNIRWHESSRNAFMTILEADNMFGYLKTPDHIIEKYLILQGFNK